MSLLTCPPSFMSPAIICGRFAPSIIVREHKVEASVHPKEEVPLEEALREFEEAPLQPTHSFFQRTGAMIEVNLQIGY